MKTKQIQILFIEPIKARSQHHFLIQIMKRIHRCCPGIIFRLRKIRNHIGCSSAIGDDAMDSHIRSQLLTQYAKTVIDKDLCIQRIFSVFRASCRMSSKPMKFNVHRRTAESPGGKHILSTCSRMNAQGSVNVFQISFSDKTPLC